MFAWMRARDANSGATTPRWTGHSALRARTAESAVVSSTAGSLSTMGRCSLPSSTGGWWRSTANPGALRWSTRLLPEDSTGYSITMAPRVAGNKVIVGVAGGEFTPHRGFFAAFDIDSGRELWRFYTVPGDPSKPFENKALEAAAKTWTGEWWKFGGGGSLWDGLSYDPEANLIYVGTGNGVPWPQILRGQDGYDNLYVSSILAVNPDNGELKWHYQAVPGDSWDIDTVQQLILADIEIGGRPRKVLMQASKGGFFYVLDRITGEFLSATPFAPLNWASGHDAAGRPRINREAYYTTTQPAVISPSSGGAANWAAKAYSPNTRLVYMPVSGFTSRTYVAIPFDLTAGRSIQNNGTPRGGRMPSQVTAAPVTPPYIGPPRSLTGGYLVAFDPATRTERWRVDGGGGSGGGALVTASNLVFQTVNDGRLRALAAEDGTVLWEVQTGQRGMGPPITYQLDGKQHISLEEIWAGCPRLPCITNSCPLLGSWNSTRVCVPCHRMTRISSVSVSAIYVEWNAREPTCQRSLAGSMLSATPRSPPL